MRHCLPNFEMLPVLMHNMEGSSSLNNNGNNFCSVYDENIILNSVRNRRKVSEHPNCPVCSCTIRHGELESHLAMEVERLQKVSSGSKRKISANSPSSTNIAVPGSSTNTESPSVQEVDVSGFLGSDVYQRVHTNRLRRLRARRRLALPPESGQCPICNTSLPISKLQRHALRCLEGTGGEQDYDQSDASSEEGSIDVENDEPLGGSFGAEYQWCGKWRIRATALQAAEARLATNVRRASNDQALVVDDDEDTKLYGPPQYSPSRIAPDSDSADDSLDGETRSIDSETRALDSMKMFEFSKRYEALEPNAPAKIQALKEKIQELERRQNSDSEVKCLICLGPYNSPAVSIQCWHVYCEVCWLQSLKAKKICPQCNAITTTQHLRKIYM